MACNPHLVTVPITFPAHAIAALPFRGVRWLPGTAMVIGSAAPDFAFLLGPTAGVWSHRPTSLILFCVPVGLCLYFALEQFILPAMREASASLRVLFASRGPPANLRGWAAASFTVLVGALTHLLFDSVTHHDRWPGAVIFSESGAARAHLVTSIGSSLIVIAWAVTRIRRDRVRGARGDPKLAALLITTAFFGGVTANLVAEFFAFGHPTLGRGWKIFAGVFLGVLIVATIRRALHWRTRDSLPDERAENGASP